ncbi:uncharacterized protein AMSG_12324 [Thecamonas trahens ATCC 50062]|uniref:TmcB/TmcC TPR repeats domain-containing protein n=1 Tax=Thecamonas trahens ATCC 50062 TaxID=461836 RepID=A0A0L0DQV7_THETB|nr:hypothetical protein AMSG_12324 [Thecamonas trahens ATCC 50062]KNC54406.1 hypothetical protein AMSG_12324 [Thecamonas trahens ATCC 50062]|eukprot:XP_013753741.1 hypothetical protein AMSG_12324 [Thecamonas trahens ATCC 50062]
MLSGPDTMVRGLRKWAKSVQDGLFAALYAMHQARSPPPAWRAAAVFTIDMAQLMAFAFHAAFPMAHSPTEALASSVHPDVDDLSIVSLALVLLSRPMFLALGGVVVVFLLAVFGNLLAVMHAFSTGRGAQLTWPITTLNIFVMPTLTIFYIPIIQLLLIPLACVATEGPDAAHSYGWLLDPDTKCYTGWGLGLAVSAATILVALLAMALPMALVYFDPRPHSPDVFARPLGRCSLLLLTAKSIIAATFRIPPPDSLAEIKATIIVVVFAFLLYFHLTRLPYYSATTNTAVGAAYGALLGAAVGAAIAVVNASRTASWPIYLIPSSALALALAAAALVRLRLSRLEASICRRLDRLPEWVQALQASATTVPLSDTVFSLPHATQIDPLSGDTAAAAEAARLGAALRRSFLSSPRAVERAVRIYLSARVRAAHASDAASDPDDPLASLHALAKVYDHHAAALFELGTELYPQSTVVRVTYALYTTAFSPQAAAAALTAARATKSMTSSLDARYAVYAFERSLLNEARGGGAVHGGLDVASFVEFEEHFNVASIAHRHALSLTHRLWVLIQDADVDADAFSDLVSALTAARAAAKAAYAQLLTRFSYSYDLLNIYADFVEHFDRNYEVADAFRARAESYAAAAANDKAGRSVAEASASCRSASLSSEGVPSASHSRRGSVSSLPGSSRMRQSYHAVIDRKISRASVALNGGRASKFQRLVIGSPTRDSTPPRGTSSHRIIHARTSSRTRHRASASVSTSGHHPIRSSSSSASGVSKLSPSSATSDTEARRRRRPPGSRRSLPSSPPSVRPRPASASPHRAEAGVSSVTRQTLVATSWTESSAPSIVDRTNASLSESSSRVPQSTGRRPRAALFSRNSLSSLRSSDSGSQSGISSPISSGIAHQTLRRYRAARQRALSAKSRAVLRLRWSLRVASAVLGLLFVIGFAFLIAQYKDFDEKLRMMNTYGRMRKLSLSMDLHTTHVQQDFASRIDRDHAAEHAGVLATLADTLSDHMSRMYRKTYGSARLSSPQLDALWRSPYIPVIYAVHKPTSGTVVRTTRQRSLWDAGAELIASVRSVASRPLAPWPISVSNIDSDVLFVRDNIRGFGGTGELGAAFGRGGALFVASIRAAVNSLRTTQLVVCIASVVTVIIIGGAVLYPSHRALRYEQRESFRLFSTIPPAIAAEVSNEFSTALADFDQRHAQLSDTNGPTDGLDAGMLSIHIDADVSSCDSTIDGNGSDTGGAGSGGTVLSSSHNAAAARSRLRHAGITSGGRLSILHRVFYRITGALVVLATLSLAFLVVGLIYASSVRSHGSTINKAGIRRYHAAAIHFSAYQLSIHAQRALGINPLKTSISVPDIESVRGALVESANALWDAHMFVKYGNAAAAGTDGQFPALDNLMYARGLDTLLAGYVSQAHALHTLSANLTSTNASLVVHDVADELAALEDSQLNALLEEAVTIIGDAYAAELHVVRIIAVAIIVSQLVFLGLVYAVVFARLVASITDEAQRSRSLIFIIRPEIIQLLPQLAHFIETGEFIELEALERSLNAPGLVRRCVLEVSANSRTIVGMDGDVSFFGIPPRSLLRLPISDCVPKLAEAAKAQPASIDPLLRHMQLPPRKVAITPFASANSSSDARLTAFVWVTHYRPTPSRGQFGLSLIEVQPSTSTHRGFTRRALRKVAPSPSPGNSNIRLDNPHSTFAIGFVPHLVDGDVHMVPAGATSEASGRYRLTFFFRDLTSGLRHTADSVVIPPTPLQTLGPFETELVEKRAAVCSHLGTQLGKIHAHLVVHPLSGLVVDAEVDPVAAAWLDADLLNQLSMSSLVPGLDVHALVSSPSPIEAVVYPPGAVRTALVASMAAESITIAENRSDVLVVVAVRFPLAAAPVEVRELATSREAGVIVFATSGRAHGIAAPLAAVGTSLLLLDVSFDELVARPEHALGPSLPTWLAEPPPPPLDFGERLTGSIIRFDTMAVVLFAARPSAVTFVSNAQLACHELSSSNDTPSTASADSAPAIMSASVQTELYTSAVMQPIAADAYWTAARAEAQPQLKELASLELLSNLRLSASRMATCLGASSLSVSRSSKQKILALWVYLTAPLWAWVLLIPVVFPVVHRYYERHVALASTTSTAALVSSSARTWIAYAAALVMVPLSTAAGISLYILVSHWSQLELSLAERMAPLLGYTLVYLLALGLLFTKLSLLNEQYQLDRLRALLDRASVGVGSVDAVATSGHGSLSHRDMEALLATYEFDGTDGDLVSLLSEQQEQARGHVWVSASGAWTEQQESESMSGMYLYEYVSDYESTARSSASEFLDDLSSSSTTDMEAGPRRPAPLLKAREQDDAIIDRMMALFASAASSWRRILCYVALALSISAVQALLGPVYRSASASGGFSLSSLWRSHAFALDAAWYESGARILALYALFVTTLSVVLLLFKALAELRFVEGHLRALHEASTRKTSLVARASGKRKPYVLTIENQYMLYLWAELRTRIRARMEVANREAGPVAAMALAGVITLTLFVIVRIVTLPHDGAFFDALGVYTLFNMVVLLLFLYAIVSAGISIASYRTKQQFFLTTQKHKLRKQLSAAVEASSQAATKQALMQALDAQILEVADQPAPSILSIALTAQLPPATGADKSELAMFFFNSGEYESAEVALGEVAAGASTAAAEASTAEEKQAAAAKAAKAHHMRALALHRLKRPEDAIDAFDCALDLLPDGHEAAADGHAAGDDAIAAVALPRLDARLARASVLLDLGRAAEAETEATAVTEAVESAFGPADEKTIAARTTVLRAQRAKGEVEAAVDGLGALMQAAAGALGPRHPQTSIIWIEWLEAMHAAGGHPDVLQAFNEFMAVAEAVLGKTDSRLVDTRLRVSQSMVALGFHHEAVDVLKAAVRIRREVLGKRKKAGKSKNNNKNKKKGGKKRK